MADVKQELPDFNKHGAYFASCLGDAPKPEELCAKCGGKRSVHEWPVPLGHTFEPAPPKSRCTCPNSGKPWNYRPGICPEHGVNRPGQALDAAVNAALEGAAAVQRLLARIRELEANLAKAVEALRPFERTWKNAADAPGLRDFERAARVLKELTEP